MSLPHDRPPQAQLDPEEPHFALLGKGYVGTTAWAICTHSDGLKIALKLSGGRILNFDVTTPAERIGLYKLGRALVDAAEVMP